MVFGDSYTVGYDARPLEKGWAYLVGQQLGWPTQVEGLSGTGLTWAGTGTVRQTYTQRLAGLTTSANPAPNVLVIQGGQNDYRASAGEIRDALVALIAQARTAWPGVQIAVVGPAGPFPLVNTLGRIDAAYAAGAAAGGAPYISPVQEKWFTESNSPEYAIADGAHVNTAGHAYMAEKFLLAFSKVTGGAIKPPAG